MLQLCRVASFNFLFGLLKLCRVASFLLFMSEVVAKIREETPFPVRDYIAPNASRELPRCATRVP